MDEDYNSTWRVKLLNSIRSGKGKTFIDSFLNSEIDINDLKTDGHTLLNDVVACGKIEIIDYLIKKGANREIRNADGSSALHIAASYGHKHIIEFFCNQYGSDLNVQNHKGCTPLTIAAMMNHKHVVEFLLKSGANVEIPGIGNWTVLHYACAKGWLDIVKFVVNKKCNLNAKSKLGRTPLSTACLFEENEIIKLLVESGADFQECILYDSCTLLHYASTEGLLEVVTTLVKNGADFNAVNSNGETPLHCACRKNNVEIIKYLLEAGANWAIKDEDNITAFGECLKIAPNEVVGLFVERGAYFEDSDYVTLYENKSRKGAVLKDVQLCSQSIINNFNNVHLPAFYELPGCIEKLPPIETLKIVPSQNVTREIVNKVESDIYTNEYCNLKDACPIVLKMLSVKALINHYRSKDNRKKRKIQWP